LKLWGGAAKTGLSLKAAIREGATKAEIRFDVLEAGIKTRTSGDPTELCEVLHAHVGTSVVEDPIKLLRDL
jgi:hypothetical protein